MPLLWPFLLVLIHILFLTLARNFKTTRLLYLKSIVRHIIHVEGRIIKKWYLIYSNRNVHGRTGGSKKPTWDFSLSTTTQRSQILDYTKYVYILCCVLIPLIVLCFESLVWQTWWLITVCDIHYNIFRKPHWKEDHQKEAQKIEENLCRSPIRSR